MIAKFETNMGNFDIELYDKTMPLTVGNFKRLVEQGFYDGLVFHRIIPDFMIQGGCPNGNGTGGPGFTIPDEFAPSNRNDQGTISMANAGPNTGGSQFFINVVNNNYLDNNHPVFGKVVDGMDVILKISKVKTDAMDKPVDAVVINKVTIK